MSAFDYQEFLDSIDKAAYHEGEWQWEEDGYTVTRTYNYSFPGCHDSCGILLYVKDGKLDHVEGDPLDPCTNGKLCMRCLDLPEMVNNEHRIKYPMKRTGERGENKWERITWDEALDITEKYIKEEIDGKGYGRESIVVGHGTGRNINWQIPFLAGATFGTPNCGGIYFSGWSCYMPRVCGAAGPLGDYPETDCAQALEKRYGDSSWQAPDVMIIWAVEPLKSNGDGFIGHYLMVCHQLGSKIISIDPALTWWGAHAEIWLRPNPGTDAALALAMANVITQEDLIDHEFVANWVAYYDEFKEHVAQFTPEWQESITNVSADDVRAAARMYAAADRGMIKWGLSFDASSASCMHWVQTACALMAICGNIEKPGTMILVHNAYEMNAGYGSVDVFGPPETVAKKFKKAQVGMPGVDFVGMSNPDAMAKALETGDPYPILMFWGQSCNQIAGHEEPAPRAYKYLSKVPFIVYVDPILTPSAVAFADMVLPVSASCERDSVRTWWVPLRAMKKVTQFYEAKTDEEIAFWLGERFNPKLFGPGKRFTCPTDLLTEYMTTGLAAIDEDGTVHKGDFSGSGNEDNFSRSAVGAEDEDNGCPYKTHQELVEAGGHSFDPWNATYYKHEKGMLRPDGQLGFNTPSGRIELIPTTFVAWGIPPYPVYTPVSKSKDTTPEIFDTYPYYCINGTRSYEFFHTEHRMAETMREFHPEPLVKMSPAVAAKEGIKDGDWVWIENWDGRCKQMAKITNECDDRFIIAEHGWWKPEEEIAAPHLCGAFDFNVNNLTHAYESGPGNIGAPIKCLPCRIYKVQEGDVMPGTQVVELGGFRDYEPMQP